MLRHRSLCGAGRPLPFEAYTNLLVDVIHVTSQNSLEDTSEEKFILELSILEIRTSSEELGFSPHEETELCH